MGEPVQPPVYLATPVAVMRAGSDGVVAQIGCTMPSVSTSVTRRRSRPSVAAWVLLVVVALGAVATVAVMVWALTYGDEPSAGLGEDLLMLVASAAFVVWVLAPFAAMGATVFFADRRALGGRAVMVVLAVGVASLVAIAAAALADFVTSDSSTDALIFIFLPFYQLVVVALTAAAAFGIGALVRRHRQRRLPPDAPRAGAPGVSARGARRGSQGGGQGGSG